MPKKTTEATPELSPNAVTVLERRYLRRDEDGKVLETPKDMFTRVADTIAAAEKEETESDLKLQVYRLRLEISKGLEDMKVAQDKLWDVLERLYEVRGY